MNRISSQTHTIVLARGIVERGQARGGILVTARLNHKRATTLSIDSVKSVLGWIDSLPNCEEAVDISVVKLHQCLSQSKTTEESRPTYGEARTLDRKQNNRVLPCVHQHLLFDAISKSVYLFPMVKGL